MTLKLINKILLKHTLNRIKEETQKEFDNRISKGKYFIFNFYKGRVVMGSSLFKKMLGHEPKRAKSTHKEEPKSGGKDLLYFDDSIKSKARFRKVMHS